MAKSTKPRKDWDAIKLDYIQGMPLNEIQDKYNIDKPQVVKKAKQKGWGEHKSFAKTYDALATATNNMIEDHLDEYPDIKEMREKLNSQLLPSQVEQSNKDLAMIALYKHSLITAQQKIAQAINKSADQINEILETNPGGLYTSRIGADGSTSYEPTNNHLKNLATFFTENNKVLGFNNAPQVAIQQNNQDKDTPNYININIIGE